MIVDCVCMRVNILVNFCIIVDGLWYGLELPVCREGAHCLHPAQGRAVKHPRGVVPGVQLSTDLREVSQCLEKALVEAFSFCSTFTIKNLLGCYSIILVGAFSEHCET